MPDFTVLTDEQVAAPQAENARLRAHIQKAADDALKAGLAAKSRTAKSAALMHHVWHLAALGETK